MSGDVIFTQCHLVDEAQYRLMRVSVELMRRLNPGIPILLVDNASTITPDFDADYLIRFKTAIGHFDLSPPDSDPRDGPGRAMMSALTLATTCDFDRAVYIEGDCLYFRSVQWGFDQMKKRVGMQPICRHRCYDTQVMWFADLKWLRESKFVERFNWPALRRQVGGVGEGKFGEMRYARLFEDNLDIVQTRGERDEWESSPEQLRAKYPQGIDFLTHAREETNREALKINGHMDLMDKV